MLLELADTLYLFVQIVTGLNFVIFAIARRVHLQKIKNPMEINDAKFNELSVKFSLHSHLASTYITVGGDRGV